MSNLAASVLKEISEKKEEHITLSEVHETKEIPDIQKKVIQEADIDSAKTYSLSSIIEMNKSDLEYSMQEFIEGEGWEYTDGKAELSEEEYSKISNKTFVTGTPTTVAFKEGVTQSKKLVGSKEEQSVVDFLVRHNYLEENK